MEQEYKFKIATQCMTFNQSPYIEETLNGFCIQQTTFPMVFIVVDDASTDGEQDLLHCWADSNLLFNEKESVYRKQMNYGELIFARHKINHNAYFAILFLNENHFGKKSKTPYYEQWVNSAEYVAFCEGDDYWTDSQKMQRQIDYMDDNIECGLSYTRCMYFFQKNGTYRYKQGGPYYLFEDIISHNNCVPTMTTIVRTSLWNRYLKEIDLSSKKWKMSDFPRWIWFSHESKVKFFSIDTGVYRILQESASHSNNLEKRIQFIESTHSILRYFSELFGVEELYNIDLYYKSLFSLFFQLGELKRANEVYKLINKPSFKEIIKNILSKNYLIYKIGRKLILRQY